ncbi:MAG: SulP family inorganic anion transporter [Aquificota bacterium]|nr:SulP family inorganic anion transporter [Aquificota bacterium]
MLKRVFPFLGWSVSKDSLIRDLTAGLTVAVVLVPQSMAYAMLAGLPPVVGLYASALAPAVAALWGSSPQLQTGPVAIVSLLVFTSLMSVAQPETEEFVKLAAVLALVAGVFQVALGVFRLGFIMNFVSHAVVIGFSNAAAIIIASTQVPHLLGITVEKHEFVFKNFLEIAEHIGETHPYTAVIGVLATVFIIISRRIHPLFPGALIAVVLSTVIAYYLNLEEKGVKVVGDIPSGLPKPSVPTVDADILEDLVGKAVVIAIIGFMEAYAIAKTMASQTKTRLDVDQELVGQGLANIVNSFFRGYPVSGSFSRSAVNFLAGAKTGMSSVFTSVFIILTLFFLAPLLYNLPRAVLASVVIVAVLGIVKPKAFVELFRTNPQDGVVAVVTFAFSFIMKPDYAIFIGIVLSLVLFLWRSMYPRIVVLTRDPGTRTFVNADLFNLPVCPQILFVRPDASLYFANAEHIIEAIDENVRKSKSLKFLLIDCESVNYVDATAVEVLREYSEELERRGVRLYFVNLKTPVRQTLMRAGVLTGEEGVLPSKGQAISKLFNLIDHDFCRRECGVAVFDECSSVKELVRIKEAERDLIRELYRTMSRRDDVKVYIGDADRSLLVFLNRRSFEISVKDLFVDEEGRVFISPSKVFQTSDGLTSAGELGKRAGLESLNGYPVLGRSPDEVCGNLIRLLMASEPP